MDRKKFLKNSLLASGTILLPSAVCALDKNFTTNVLNVTENEELEFSYTNPFVPIWCEGDDYSHAIIKPSIFYKEISGSKIEIENMPAYKTQSDLGECKAYSLAAILQQYVNTKWKSDIPDPKNPPADMAISYFGLMAYTNQNKLQENSLQFLQINGNKMREVIDNLSKNGNRLILENCKNFENLTKEFSLNGKKGLEKRDDFLNYSKEIFQNLKSINEQNIKDYTQEINKLNEFVNLGFNQKTLKKALTKNIYDEFLYTLFFDDCKKENFPSGFRAAIFPLDSMNVTYQDIKLQVIKGLNIGKPVLFPSLCASQNIGEICNETHSLVISGFKKVKYGNTQKDVLKIHNSWGEEWQKKNNDGWIDADTFVNNTAKVKTIDGNYRIGSSSVIWLD